MKSNKKDLRRKQLAMIHLAKKELGLDDDLYRSILQDVCGVESSKDLDSPGRNKLLAYFRGKGWGRREYSKGKPHNFNEPARKRMMRKIEALLADSSRPWSYADALAKRICKVERLAFCKPDQLGKIIAALTYQAKREGRTA